MHEAYDYTIKLNKQMKTILQKIFQYKIGEYALCILFYTVILPIHLLGKVIVLITKPVRALGLLLMGNVNSAVEEITDWRISLSLRDVL